VCLGDALGIAGGEATELFALAEAAQSPNPERVTWARIDPIVVWQADTAGVGQFGHVGYVADLQSHGRPPSLVNGRT
jgi:hypothetical protein